MLCYRSRDSFESPGPMMAAATGSADWAHLLTAVQIHVGGTEVETRELRSRRVWRLRHVYRSSGTENIVR